MNEKLAPGLQFEWINEHGILSYAFSDSKRVSVDAWITHYTGWLDAHDTLPRVRLVIDATEQGLSLSPYIGQQARALATRYPDLVGRCAFVHGNPVVKAATTFFMNRWAQQGLVAESFANRADAILWLISPAKDD